MGMIHQRHLQDQRDGLLREAEYLRQRLERVNEEVVRLNLLIAPQWPQDMR